LNEFRTRKRQCRLKYEYRLKCHWVQTRTINKPIYQDELLKNMTIEICYKVTNATLNSIYIIIYVQIEGYNRYELCAYIDNGYFAYYGKGSLFPEFMGKKVENSLQVNIANNSIKATFSMHIDHTPN